MDGSRFDELVRLVAGDRSRRGIVRAAAGSLVGSSLAALGLGVVPTVAAKKKKKKKKHPAPPVVPPSPPPCQRAQQSCGSGCCSGLMCSDNFCGPVPHSVCCGALGATCGEDCDCCDGGICDGGHCGCDHPLCSGRCLLGDECCVNGDCDAGKECNFGFCDCAVGTLTCGDECCDTEADQVCKAPDDSVPDPPPDACQGGGCIAAATDYCTDPNAYICGEVDQGAPCFCATSIGDQKICSDFLTGSCNVDCTSDVDCQAFDPDAVCIPNGDPFCTDFCNGNGQNFCVVPGCPSTDAAAAAAGRHARSRVSKGGVTPESLKVARSHLIATRWASGR